MGRAQTHTKCSARGLSRSRRLQTVAMRRPQSPTYCPVRGSLRPCMARFSRAGASREPQDGALDSGREPEDDHRRGARPRRRAGARGGSLPRRRQQPRLPGVFRAARGAGDERRLPHECAARLHEHARQAPLGLPPARRRSRLGHEARAPDGHLGRVQVRPPADARPAARAVPVLQADRGGVRLPKPRVRGLGG